MPSTSATLADARRMCAAGRFHAATDLLLDAFRSNPEDAEVALELGATMRACGDFSCAIEYLQRAHNVAPQDARTVAELVLSYHALDQHDAASRVLIRSLAIGLRSEELAEHLRDAA